MGLSIRWGDMVRKECSKMISGFFWLESTGCVVTPFTEMGKRDGTCVLSCGLWQISNPVLAVLSLNVY